MYSTAGILLGILNSKQFFVNYFWITVQETKEEKTKKRQKVHMKYVIGSNVKLNYFWVQLKALNITKFSHWEFWNDYYEIFKSFF